MEPEDDKNVLKHLLHLETEASALVDDAQAEADRRLSESETQCRSLHDQTYTAEVAKLEAAYLEEIAQVRENYKNQLDVYRSELLGRHPDEAAFGRLANQFLSERN